METNEHKHQLFLHISPPKPKKKEEEKVLSGLLPMSTSESHKLLLKGILGGGLARVWYIAWSVCMPLESV